MNPRDVLNAAHTILVIDWPSRDVPDALALAGFEVIVRGGPGPDDYVAYELMDGQIVPRKLGRPPQRTDLIYSFRPLSELPGIIATAKQLGAKTIWTQSGVCQSGAKDPRGCWLSDSDLLNTRRLIQSADLQHIAQPYIADVARELRPVH